MNHTDRRVLRVGSLAMVIMMLVATMLSQPLPVSASAANYYVSTSGNNANPGTLSRPWRTLQKAADVATAGTTIHVRSGTYSGFVVLRSGSSSAPITFRPYASERVVIAGNTSTADVIRISDAHDVVIRGFTVRDAKVSQSGSGIRVDRGSYRITVTDNLLTENRSFGISIIDSTSVLVSNNEVKGNAEGVYVRGAGAGVQVLGNKIHHQDRMVVSTPGGSDDYGGVGVALVRTTGQVLVKNNRIYGNRAVSHDWGGYDGAAVEIYGAKNAKIVNNRIWNNRVVMETGSSGDRCEDNVFARNLIWGATTRDVSKGILLRCAERMLIANNTFYLLDEWIFDLKEGGSGHATSISGLRILNNIAVMGHGKIFGVESNMPASVTVDYNLLWHTAGGTIGSKAGKGWTTSMAEFTRWTGFNVHGVNKTPQFVDGGQRDFHLRSTSPALDRGRLVSGVTGNYKGSAPDIGRFEAR